MEFQIFNEFVFGFYPGIFTVLLLGFFVGYLSSFLGIGGGFIYTPFYHTFFHLSAVQAVAVSLAQMPVSALSGLIVYHKGDKIRWREGFLLLITSLPSAQLVAYKFGRFEDTELGKKIVFGLPLSELLYLIVFTFFLTILGIWNLVSASRKKRNVLSLDANPTPLNLIGKSDSGKPSKHRALSLKSLLMLLVTGVFFGATSSLLGIGGGFLAVPLFVYYFRMEPVEAVATSFLGIFFTSIGTSILYYSQGNLHISLPLIGTMGGFIGARLGSLRAIKAEPYFILRVMGTMQIIVVIWYFSSKFFSLK